MSQENILVYYRKMVSWRRACFKALVTMSKIGESAATYVTFIDTKTASDFVAKKRKFHSFCITASAQSLDGVPIQKLHNNHCIHKKNHCLTLRSDSSASQKHGPPWNVLFYGTDNFSLESLVLLHNNWLHGDPKIINHLEVVTVPFQRSLLPVRKYALENQIVFHDWPHCPSEGKFDVGVVVSFGHLIPFNVIQEFPFGMLNIHPSLLPRWRGSTPEIHTILHGDTETGVTIMAIEPHEFDTGKILLQQSVSVKENMTASELSGILRRLGADMLMTSLNDLCHLLKNSRCQDPAMATKAPKIKKDQAIIIWENHSCQYIDRLYRALNHKMKLLTSWNGKLVKLSSMISPVELMEINVNKLVDITKISPAAIKPGKIIYYKRKKLLCIMCADGWVGFREVMIEGHNSKTAVDFYNGFMSKVDSSQHYFQ